MQTRCTICGRDLTDEVYKMQVCKMTLKEVCKTSDIRDYGLECCVPLLALRHPTIRTYSVIIEPQNFFN